jgi:hypothetical protein
MTFQVAIFTNSVWHSDCCLFKVSVVYVMISYIHYIVYLTKVLIILLIKIWTSRLKASQFLNINRSLNPSRLKVKSDYMAMLPLNLLLPLFN